MEVEKKRERCGSRRSNRPCRLRPSPAPSDSAESEGAGEGRSRQGRFERRDPQRSRFFSTSTARPVGGGAFYASLAPLALQAGVGISDVLSLRAATAFGFDGENPEYALRAAPKLTVYESQAGASSNSATLSVALDARATARYQTYPNGRDWAFAMLPRTVATYGTPEASLTAAAGVPLTTSDGSGLLAATLGGEVQVLNWLKLISENHLYVGASQRYDLFLSGGGEARLLPEETTFASLSGGARLMWDRFSFETGLVTRAGADFDGGTGMHLRLSYRF